MEIKDTKNDLSRECDASGSLTGDCIENIRFAWVKINLKLKMNLNMNMSMNLNLNLNLNNICVYVYDNKLLLQPMWI